MGIDPTTVLETRSEGLYCPPGGFHIDPHRPVDRAVITHGHADHCRPGHAAALMTPETAAIARARYGDTAFGSVQTLPLATPLRIGDVTVRLAPAGHVLGAAQIVIEHRDARVVVSGDYKCRPDPTVTPFEPVSCDLFVTEATFGLPVFRHPPTASEIARLLAIHTRFPERTIALGAYALGKAQRLIAELRGAGYDRPIWIHGALSRLCETYSALGIDLGDLRAATAANRAEMAGQIVLAPPSALADRWSRRLADPLTAAASGWMRVRQRARQRGVELALVISDHADWDELTATIEATGASHVWVTHGAEDALVHWCTTRGIAAQPLSLAGRTDPEAEL